MRSDSSSTPWGGRCSKRRIRAHRLEVERFETRTLLAASPLRIGALGDSLTDEYAFYAPDRTAARNWVEVLSATRSDEVDFGASSTITRGETRNQGFAQNWARSGARAQGPDVADANTTFVEQYRGGFAPGLPGLLTQPGGVSDLDVVTILIGGNDYLAAIESAVSDPSGIFEALIETNAGIISAVQTVVPQLQAANPDLEIVLITTPDIGLTALFRDTIAILPAADQQLIQQVLDGFTTSLTQQLTAYAQGQGLGLVNLDDLITNFQANPFIDGVYVNPNTGGAAFTNMFVGDRFHPGTVAQAILANAIAGQINTFFPGAVTPLGDAEIVAFARQAQPVTSATLTASSNAVAPGRPLTFNVRVATFPPINTVSLEGTFPIPTGFITFFDASAGNRLLEVAALNPEGIASLTTSDLGLGSHAITAVYGGDNVYPAAVPMSIQVAVGSPRQIALIRAIGLYQRNLGQSVTPPGLRFANRFLNRGVSPDHLARATYRRVGHLTRPSRPFGLAARLG